MPRGAGARCGRVSVSRPPAPPYGRQAGAWTRRHRSWNDRCRRPPGGLRRARPVRRASEGRSAPGRRGQPWTGTASLRRAAHRPHSVPPPTSPGPDPRPRLPDAGIQSRPRLPARTFGLGRVSRCGLSGSAASLGAGFRARPRPSVRPEPRPRLPAQVLTLGPVCRHKSSAPAPCSGVGLALDPASRRRLPASAPPLGAGFQPRPCLATQVLAPGLVSRRRSSPPAPPLGTSSQSRPGLPAQALALGPAF